MNAGCCTGGTAARRFSPAILPAALLAVLPKCPLCFAAWIAAATGVALPPFLAPWTKVMAIAVGTLVAIVCGIRLLPCASERRSDGKFRPTLR